MPTQDVTLEQLTWHTLDVRKLASLCSDDELMLAVAKLRDAMNKAPDRILEARHDALLAVIAERRSGSSKRRALPFFSIYQGKQWAIDRLSGLKYMEAAP